MCARACVRVCVCVFGNRHLDAGDNAAAMLLERRVQFRNQMVQRIDARNDLLTHPYSPEYSRTLILLSTHVPLFS